ncbi:hypothetical protein, partial [Streptomyces sp. NPDC101149]|uniref:hypothetical protein n=1 Tax=Streptomyces sp. NPDC101149 TaxID=3366113 RepID=UPI003810AFD9
MTSGNGDRPQDPEVTPEQPRERRPEGEAGTGKSFDPDTTMQLKAGVPLPPDTTMQLKAGV